MPTTGSFPPFLLVALLISVPFTACVRREGRNSDCKWPDAPDARLLHPNQRGYEGQLRGDVEFAEELAVEYMDAQYGPRSGKFRSQQTASHALNACLGTLLEEIGQSHNISPGEAARFLGRRSFTSDIAVGLSFLLLYCLLAATVAGRLLRRYPPEDGRAGAILMTTFSSVASGAGGMLLGEQWAILAESIRAGTGHLSYRLDRLPWIRHHVIFFVLCTALFWAIVIVRYRGRRLEMAVSSSCK